MNVCKLAKRPAPYLQLNCRVCSRNLALSKGFKTWGGYRYQEYVFYFGPINLWYIDSSLSPAVQDVNNRPHISCAKLTKKKARKKGGQCVRETPVEYIFPST